MADSLEVDVNGATLQSIIDGMTRFQSVAKRILTENNIDLQPDELRWYKLQQWLNVLNTIAEKADEYVLIEIGLHVPENAVFPKEIQTIETALQSINMAYHMNHRYKTGELLYNPTTGEMYDAIGHYNYRSTGAKCAEIICDNPYPCDFDLGIITTMATKFEPQAKIKHKIGSCRKQGDKICVYEITW